MDLPVELIVIIISLLSSRNIVKLYYVSKRLRTLTEVPSLWKKFVWPYYDLREQASVSEIWKVYGRHIRLLSLDTGVNCRILSSNLRYLISMCCSYKRCRSLLPGSANSERM